jgi:hypothetical protein
MTLVFQTGERQLYRLPIPERRPALRVRTRKLVVGRTTYKAFDAHSLLQLDSEESLARPGRIV